MREIPTTVQKGSNISAHGNARWAFGSDRYAALEEKLHKELADERAKFEAELEAARGKLNEREAGLDEREKSSTIYKTQSTNFTNSVAW